MTIDELIKLLDSLQTTNHTNLWHKGYKAAIDKVREEILRRTGNDKEN